MVGADVPHSHVVTHDEDDVGFFVLRQRGDSDKRCAQRDDALYG